jgi:hypothetical protein
MPRKVLVALSSVLAASFALSAADREWQRGVWAEVTIKRPKFVLGVQPRSRAGQPPVMTVVRTYVIDAEDLRLELKEPSPPPLRSVDALVGEPVTFALEKNTVYVRGADGTEYRLQVTRRGHPPKGEPQR